MKRKIITILRDLWGVIKETTLRWDQANPWRQSAILAYYSIFSLPALLLIIIVMAGYFFGQEAVSNELSVRIEHLIGSESAGIIETMVANAADPGSSSLAFWAGIGFLLFGATTVFYQLQLSLNHVWGVIPKPRKAFLKYLRDRLFSFGLVLAIGFLLMLSLVVNSLLSMLGSWLRGQWPELFPPFMTLLSQSISLVVLTVMFALMFKILPDAIIRWRSVWVGSLITALLFGLGQYGLSLYFQYADPASIYGAAGSLILIMIWISYVAMILLFGAQFTKQWAIKFGHGIKPKESAELVDMDDPGFSLTE